MPARSPRPQPSVPYHPPQAKTPGPWPSKLVDHFLQFLLNVVATGIGVLLGFNLSVGQDIRNYTVAQQDARRAAAEQDSIAAGIYVHQIEINRWLVQANIDSLNSELGALPLDLTFPVLNVPLDLGHNIPVLMAREPGLRGGLIRTLVLTQALNTAIDARNNKLEGGELQQYFGPGGRHNTEEPGSTLIDADRALLRQHRQLRLKIDSLQTAFRRNRAWEFLGELP